MFFGILNDFGDVRPDTRRETVVLDRLYQVSDPIDFAQVPTVVGMRAVVINGDGFIARDLADVALDITELGGRLRNPLDVASAIAM